MQHVRLLSVLVKDKLNKLLI